MAAMIDRLAARLETWGYPEFPPSAPPDGENDVEVEVTVDNATGSVRGVLAKTGDEPYRKAASKAIFKWSFKPGPELRGQTLYGITLCFHRGSVSITGVAQVVPGSYTGPVTPRWRQIDRSTQPRPGTVQWALAVEKARHAAHTGHVSAELLRGAYDQLLSLLGDCSSCRKREYPLLKGALEYRFHDQAAINEVRQEELADDAASYPGGSSDPKAPCDECKAAWTMAHGTPSVDELRSYLDRCRAALDRCPDRELLWWQLSSAYARYGKHPESSNVKAALELLLSRHPPASVEPGLLLALSSEVAATDPERSLKLEIDAIRHPEYPGTIATSGSNVAAKAEQRDDFETALYLMLIGGPPTVTCGNDNVTLPHYDFLLTYYKVRSGLDAEYQWLRLLDQIPAAADPELNHLLHQPEYLDRAVAAARALGREASLASRLEALRDSYASLEGRAPARPGFPAPQRSPREVEMMLAGYLAELR